MYRTARFHGYAIGVDVVGPRWFALHWICSAVWARRVKDADKDAMRWTMLGIVSGWDEMGCWLEGEQSE